MRGWKRSVFYSAMRLSRVVVMKLILSMRSTRTVTVMIEVLLCALVDPNVHESHLQASRETPESRRWTSSGLQQLVHVE